MRAALVTATLALVGAASLLNLVLGAAWALALVVILWTRRGLRPAAWLALAGSVAAGGAAWRAGMLAGPELASYAADEWAWVVAATSLAADGPVSPPEVPAATLRARLVEQRALELGTPPTELAARAGALVATTRSLDGLRRRAPAEVGAVEAAVARLALTLTTAEFRDLEARRARLAVYFAELEARLAAARDEGDLDAVARGLTPAALAPVSLQPVVGDLAAVYRAMAALVRAVGEGRGVVAETRRHVAFDEADRRLIVEDRYAFAVDGPVRILRIDVTGLGAPVGGSVTGQTLEWQGEAGDPPAPVQGGAVSLAEGAARLIVVDRRVRHAAPAPTRPLLRPIAFGRLAIGPPRPGPGPFLVTVALAGPRSPRAVLSIPAPQPRLEAVELPARALYYAGVPGTVTRHGDRDVWAPADGHAAGAGVRLELVPRSVLLRSDAFARLAPFLFRPNLGTALGIVALAAWTAVLMRRPRVPPPAGPTPTGGR